jgi:hypothetical protein
VLAVVAADAHYLRGLDWGQQRGFREGNAVHAATGEAFDVAFARLGRLEEEAGDLIAAGDRLYEAVVAGTIEVETTVSHRVRDPRLPSAQG